MFVNRIEHWGKWVILGGSAYWATMHGDDETLLKADFFREQLEKFMGELGITQFHIKAGQTGPNNEHVWFQIGIPKSQLTTHSWEEFKRNTTGWPAEPHSTWLPESQARTITYEETDADALEKAGVVLHFGDNAWGDCARHGDPYLIKLDGQPIGWFQLTNQNELNAIEVLPAYQKQGIGTEIIRQLYGDTPDPAALTATPASKSGAALLRRFGINDPEVYEALDPDDPAVNIERHTAALDLPAIMARLGFKSVVYKHLNREHWEKVIGSRVWRVEVNAAAPQATVTSRAAFGTPQNWIEPTEDTIPVNELEDVLGFFDKPAAAPDEEVDESVEAADPDDPSVNIERHIDSMAPGPVLAELGFDERWPTWRDADPEYMWWERFDFMTGLKWTVIRKSDDEPHIMEVSISRMNLVTKDWQQVGGFTVHVGGLKKKMEQALGVNWKTYEALGVPDPDDPEANVERFAQHVEKTEQTAQWKLDSVISRAEDDFVLEVERRGISNAEAADHLVGELAFKWGEYYKNGTDEYDMIVSALNNKAGEMFPGQWENYPVQESEFVSDKMDWSEFFRPLIEYNILSQQAADRYAISQNRESNEKLYYLFIEADEASQSGSDAACNADYNACVDKILRIIRVTNMRYNSAIKSFMRDVPLDEGIDDPSPEFIHAAFDVPTILKRMGYERHGEQQEWSKDFRRSPTDLDLMIGVRRRGQGGEANEGDVIYDITLYIYPVNDNPEKRWKEIANRYGRNNLQVERVLKMLEARIKANNLRGLLPYLAVAEAVTPDPDDPEMTLAAHTQDLVANPDEPAKINAHPHGEAEAELQVLGFTASWVAGKNTVFGEPEIPNFWSKRYAPNGSSGRALFIQIKPDAESVKLMARTRTMSVPVTVKPRSMAHVITIIKALDAVMQQAQSFQEEINGVLGVLDHHRQWCNEALDAPVPDPDDPQMFVQNMETDWQKILQNYGFKAGYTENYERIYPDKVWGAQHPCKVRASPDWYDYDKFIQQNWPADVADDCTRHDEDGGDCVNREGPACLSCQAYVRLTQEFNRRNFNKDHSFPDYISFQFGIEPSQTIRIPTRELDYFLRRFVARADKLVGTDTRDHGMAWLLKTAAKLTAEEKKPLLGEGADAVPEPAPDPDDPADVLKAHEHGLLDGELKRLAFEAVFAQGITHLYGQAIHDYWTKQYQAADGSPHALYLYFMSGHKPTLRANNWNADAKAWYQRGKAWPTDALGKSEAHFCAIIRDLDDAMQRSVADGLSPEQEHERIEAILKHHREWYDQTLANWDKHGITGRVGPGEPA